MHFCLVVVKNAKKEVVIINGLFFWGALGQNFMAFRLFCEHLLQSRL